PVGDHVLELPEQLETDQAEQPGPGDQGTGDDLVGHPGEDGLPDPGGIRGETFGYPWPGSRQAGVFRGWPQNAGSPRAVRVADDPRERRRRPRRWPDRPLRALARAPARGRGPGPRASRRPARTRADEPAPSRGPRGSPRATGRRNPQEGTPPPPSPRPRRPRCSRR